MGGICPCFRSAPDDELPANTSNQSSPAKYGSTAVTAISSGNAFSVRPRFPTSEDQHDGDSRKIRKAKIGKTGLDKVDKRLQEHGDFFNEFVDRHNKLRTAYIKFVQNPPPKDAPKGDIKGLLEYFRHHMGDENFELKRRHQFRMEIILKSSENLKMDIISTATIFNELNQECFHLCTKLLALQDSIKMTLSEEEEFKRDVMVHPWKRESDKVSALKTCVDNFSELRKLPPLCQRMKDEASKIFDDFLRASAALVVDS